MAYLNWMSANPGLTVFFAIMFAIVVEIVCKSWFGRKAVQK